MWNVIYLCRPPRDFDGGVYQRISTLAQTICHCFSVLAHKHTNIMRQNNKHYATIAEAAGCRVTACNDCR